MSTSALSVLDCAPSGNLHEKSGLATLHLALCGRSDQLFADDAIVHLHRLTHGVPRAVNNAPTAALIAAAADGKEIVDDACAKKAVAELTRE